MVAHMKKTGKNLWWMVAHVKRREQPNLFIFLHVEKREKRLPQMVVYMKRQRENFLRGANTCTTHTADGVHVETGVKILLEMVHNAAQHHTPYGGWRHM